MQDSVISFADAKEHQRAGRLGLAEEAYRRILKAEPEHADARHFLGVLAYQRGRFEEAVSHISRAIAQDGTNSTYLCNLGLAHRALDELDRSTACFEEALRLNPDNGVAQKNLGIVLMEQGRYEEATNYLQTATQSGLDPEAFNGLGKSLHQQGKLARAGESFRRALAVRPGYAEAQNNLGLVLRDEGEWDEAEQCFRKAVELNPDFAEAFNNLGGLLSRNEKHEEAETCLRRAIQLNPQFASAHCNLGVNLLAQERFDEAEASLVECLRIRPDFAGALTNLGAVRMHQGQADQALACVGSALRIEPNNIDAHWNRSLLWLNSGHMKKGWLEYEWRWLRPGKARHIPRPLWDGSPLEGRTILLHAEQGLGDTLQFVRFARTVQVLGGHGPAVLPGAAGAVAQSLSVSGPGRGPSAATAPLPGPRAADEFAEHLSHDIGIGPGRGTLS